ncbi:MAG: hypothetical protein IKJ79_00030 [Bacteroidaceae bacterium]|nr:hypothetical protein [Bacteroidaceae bacterium]
MRTIKFRGRDFAGMWHIGDLIHNDDDLLIRKGCFSIFIENETAGQFTGLLDKNGKEIYEGDIYRYDNPDSINEVSYCAGGGFAGFDLTPAIHSENRLLDVEVIGNIHDNPELLKQ